MIDGWDIFCEMALRRMSLDLTDDKSTLVQVMAWCLTAPSHYLSQCWPRSLSPYDVTRPQWVKANRSKIFTSEWNTHFSTIGNIFMCAMSKGTLKVHTLKDVLSYNFMQKNLRAVELESSYAFFETLPWSRKVNFLLEINYLSIVK